MWEVGKIAQKLKIEKILISNLPTLKLQFPKSSWNIITIDNQCYYILFPTFLLYFNNKNKYINIYIIIGCYIIYI